MFDAEANAARSDARQAAAQQGDDSGAGKATQKKRLSFGKFAFALLAGDPCPHELATHAPEWVQTSPRATPIATAGMEVGHAEPGGTKTQKLEADDAAADVPAGAMFIGTPDAVARFMKNRPRDFRRRVALIDLDEPTPSGSDGTKWAPVRF
eukprot:g1699.t1